MQRNLYSPEFKAQALAKARDRGTRAPYLQAQLHGLQPMHLSSSTSTMPSSARL